MDGTLGQILLFAANWAPRNWAICNGQLLAISSNTALFSILGTIYGGDGRTTFALPDLRSRVPVGMGAGPGLGNINIGQRGGQEQLRLTQGNLPAINLSIPASEENANTTDPNGAYPAVGNFYAANPSPGAQLGGGISIGGSSTPLDNHPPFLAINYIICTQGIFPSRS